MQIEARPETPVINHAREIILRYMQVKAVNDRTGRLQAQERDVRLRSFIAIDKDGVETHVEGSDSNVFARLAIQFLAHALRRSSDPHNMDVEEVDKAFFAIVFGESWEDRFSASEGKGRPLLKALDSAVRLERMTWKSNAEMA